ncbi:MAG: DNA-3-methyladenine glycosylase family protein [Paracoccaceae bacterium]
MTGRIIESADDIAEGAAWLAGRETRFAEALEQTGLPPLRRRDDGFRPLLNAIVSQQLSVAAADGIWARMEAAGATEREAVAEAREDTLRACGLSRPKIRYAKELARCGVDFAALRSLPDEAVVAKLVRIKGIGVWTAEIYAMFSLGRADMLAAGDLALQEAARVLFGLDERPAEKALREMAVAWSPWRAVAARLLWAYYRHAKRREGIR